MRLHGHNNVTGADVFPHNVGLGAANTAALMREIEGDGAGNDRHGHLLGLHAGGGFMPQDIRWGRTYAAYGENHGPGFLAGGGLHAGAARR
ncbi:MAG: hypothetical protein IPM76_27785 [Chloroflexi bacterium]|nr:hypothetical protein [Chloroflexota bacterium]